MPERPWPTVPGNSGWTTRSGTASTPSPRSGRFSAELSSAFANGRALLEAPDGLRGRTPLTIEWTGGRRPPGRRGGAHRPPDRPRLPDQLQVRVRHPGQRLPRPALRRAAGHLGDLGPQGLVRGGRPRGAGRAVPVLPGGNRARRLPGGPVALRPRAAGHAAAMPWPGAPTPTAPRVRPTPSLCRAVSDGLGRAVGQAARVHRTSPGRRCCGDCCGSAVPPTSSSATTGAPASPARYRIASPWDWRDQFELAEFTVSPAEAGQPRVDWTCTLPVRGTTDVERTVPGHVEVRWSHGRFAQPPEAKVYLDTPMSLPPRLPPAGGRPTSPSSPCGRVARLIRTVNWDGQAVPGALRPAGGLRRRCARRGRVRHAGGTRRRSSTPGAGPVGWRGSSPAGASTTVGVDLDRSMIETARSAGPGSRLGARRPRRPRPRAPVRRGGHGRKRPASSRRPAPRRRWWQGAPATSSRVDA